MSLNPKFYPILLFAGIIDGIDYIGGGLPIIGDIIDIIGVAVFALSGLGFVSFLGLTELIPFVDFLPVHLGVVILAWKLGRFSQ